MKGAFAHRTIEDSDIVPAKAIWRKVFGDTVEYIDEFFRTLYTPGTGMAAFSGGKMAAHFFSLPDLELLSPGHNALPVSYLIALAVSPEYRNYGLGSDVARETKKLAFAQGSSLACLMPADEPLFSWYERAIGSKPLFYVREREFAGFEYPTRPVLRNLSSAEYCALRERLLSAHPHISFAGRFPGWIDYECRTGGLFSIGDRCCTAVTRQETGIRIDELLCPQDDFERAVAEIAGFFNVEKSIVRSPAFWGSDETHGEIRPSVVASARPGDRLLDIPGAYWGFTFD